MRYFKSVIFIAFFLNIPALAVGISEETQYGSTLFSQSLSLDGGVGGNDKIDVDAPWDWSAQYTQIRTISTDTTGNQLIDNTREYTLGGGWTGPSGWGVEVNLVFSHTPEESLSSRGGTLTPSYRWEYLGGDPNDDAFHPYLDFKLDLESVDFLTDFSGHVFRKLKLRPISGIAELRQTSIGPGVGWKPNSTWKFSTSVDTYLYNRDVNQYTSQLDSPQALRAGVSGFGNTVGGLPKVAYNGGIDWFFADSWKASVTETYSIIAADNTSSTTFKGGVAYKMTKSWRVTATGEWDNSAIQSDAIGILNIEWDSQ